MMVDTAYALDWTADTIHHPGKIKKDTQAFMKELGTSMVALRAMYRDNHRRAIGNFFGGFLWYVKHHPTNFTSQILLLNIAGGFVMDSVGGFAKTTLTDFGFASLTTDLALKQVSFLI